ncbi:MAG: ribosome maturation factor RimP, partial [Clostridia bacterium]|nr:ribosome maturation factor RimP [Clostridia bacterium]
MKNGKNIAQTVQEFLLPVVNELGYYLWDVEYVKEGSEWYLRITIDSPDGITID